MMQKHPARLNPLLRYVCVGLFLLLLPSFANSEVSASAAVVEKLHATLIDVMKHAGNLGFQGRYDALAPVIESSFDTRLISQVILSRYWKELTPEQQRQFLAIFNRLSISTYASRFDSYSDESFKTLGVEEMKKGRQLVTSELASGNKNR
jgi:ABC-type transport system involved in resistance to organic solvents, auxiliary component